MTEDKKISKQAEEMSKENSLIPEINQAYIDNVGAEYATAEQVAEAYSGQFPSDEDFAQDIAEQLGTEIKTEWPLYCIDWEYAARELMIDYFESDGYYFQNL